MSILRSASALFVALSALAADAPAWVSQMGGNAIVDAQGRVTALDLRSTWVTDSDLPAIASLPALESLDLSLTRVSDHGLRSLKQAARLRSLKLRYTELITDEGMSMVRSLKQLQAIDLHGTKVTDTTVEYLSTLPRLERIDIGFAQITDNGLDSLGAIPNLKSLTVGGNKLTDVGLQAVRQLRALTYLDLGGAQRTDSGMWSVSLTDSGAQALATLENLEELRLRGIPISSRHLEPLNKLPKLARLGIQDCKRIGPEAVAILGTFPSLQLLDAAGSGMKTEDLNSLRNRLPRLQILD